MPRIALAQVRNDFLRHKVLRGNMMVPGETVEIVSAGQPVGSKWLSEQPDVPWGPASFAKS